MLRAGRFTLVHAGLLLFALAIVARAAHVQLMQHDEWARRAEQQQVAIQSLPAPRGAILDATGEPLVQSRESLRLAVAPHELSDREAIRTALRTAGVPARFVARAVDTARRWVELPGSYTLDAVGPLLGRDGIHATPVSERLYPSAEGIQLIVGSTRDGEGSSGIELALDSLLSGTAGSVPMLRDRWSRRFESPRFTATAPRPGNTVVLTMHHAVQEIVERALDEAVRETRASGGDVVVVNPHTGEVLAMASRRRGGKATMGVLTDPYEPGSTLKPILAARLLELQRARVDEVISTPAGTLSVPGFRRVIRDLHVEDRQSLADVIRFSSNVGIIKFGRRLTAREQYEAMRDAGFGMATGVPFPSEASGTLPHPRNWWLPTAASMAMGYGIAVTPLQLAMAYASIANGGELLEPVLVREIRSPEGELIWSAGRRVVRRVMSENTARVMRDVLAGVVDSGTARAAQLATYEVGGKSGTSRNASSGRYVADSYLASFVGLFPADEPQFVVLVKINDPAGSYFGGSTAAPVSKVVLEAFLAARDAAIDRGALVRPSLATGDAADSSVPLVSSGGSDSPARDMVAGSPPGSGADGASAVSVAEPHEQDLPEDLAVAAPRLVPLLQVDSLRAAEQQRSEVQRAVPDVRGRPLREAALRLHEAGFRVRITDAALGETTPIAGSLLPPGSLVRLGRGR